jgi:2-dehydropantoate 2-reductase
MTGNKTIKNICIFGIGGIGGVFGGMLARAVEEKQDAEHRVYFIARGAHLERIKSEGLMLSLPGYGGLLCKPALAADDIGKIPAPDLIILCVKGYDLDAALDSISANVKEDTVIVPLLNGVDIYERIRRKLKSCIILPSCVYIGSHIEAPGMIAQDTDYARIVSGKDPENASYELDELKELLASAGINCIFKEDSSDSIWEKYLFIASFALVTAWSGKTIGEVTADPELKGAAEAVIEEIMSIAASKGIKLQDGIAEKTMDIARSMGMSVKTSYQRDVEAKKMKNEGDLFGGTIIRLGKECGIATPAAEKLYGEIQKKLEG